MKMDEHLTATVESNVLLNACLLCILIIVSPRPVINSVPVVRIDFVSNFVHKLSYDFDEHSIEDGLSCH
jgi:hypothetical protein